MQRRQTDQGLAGLPPDYTADGWVYVQVFRTLKSR
jgi:hypothetical protein